MIEHLVLIANSINIVVTMQDATDSLVIRIIAGTFCVIGAVIGLFAIALAWTYRE